MKLRKNLSHVHLCRIFSDRDLALIQRTTPFAIQAVDEYFLPPAMEANFPGLPTYHPRNRASSSRSRSAMPPPPYLCDSRIKIVLQENGVILCSEISSATILRLRSPATQLARLTRSLDEYEAIPYKIAARYDAVLSPSDHGSVSKPQTSIHSANQERHLASRMLQIPPGAPLRTASITSGSP
jgi:hypothetical protein